MDDAFCRWSEALRLMRTHRADRVAFGEIAPGGTAAAQLTGADIAHRVAATADQFRLQGLASGQRVILSMPAGLDFVTSFLSVLAAGGAVVPLPCADTATRAEVLEPMVQHADASWAIAPDGASHLARLPRLVARGMGAGGRTPDLTAGQGPDALAFLQYTSGSTGRPKAVEVTHGMLAANLETIRQAMAHDDRSVFVSWLPHFHDMGLVGTILQPLYCGAEAHLMPPQRFIRRPLDWLRAISNLRATTSGAPNFAYRLCTEALEEADPKPDLDLSSWTVAFNGAEPVHDGMMARFCDIARPFGFDARAVYPCYGLAETTLFVSGGPLRSGLRTAENGVVSCGRPGPHVTVRIVDPERRRPLDAGRTGEIWVKGPNVARAYFRDPEDTAQILLARLEDGDGPYLRSGDLGVMRDGEVFVSGRMKDIVILAGRNVHPEDVEHAVVETLGGRRLRAAAFSVPCEEGERLVIAVAGITGDPGEAEDRIRETVFDAFDGATAEIAFVPRNRIPVTSSGKVRRQAARALYLGVADARTSTEDRASMVVAKVLGRTLTEHDLDKTLLALGLDSLALLRLLQALEDAGIEPPSVGALARMTALAICTLAKAAPMGPGSAPMDGPLPARLNQQSYVVQELLTPRHPRATFSTVLAIDGAPDRLADAVRRTFARHSALRLRMSADGQLSEGASAPVKRRDAPDADTARRIAAKTIREPLSLFDEPPCRADIVAAPGKTFLALRFHHAFCDLYSLGILFDDLDRTLTQSLPEGSAPDYRQAIAEERRYLASANAARAAERWRTRLAGLSASMGIGMYPGHESRLASDVPTLETSFSPDLSARLQAFAASQDVTVYTVLLSAFAAVLARFSKAESLVVACPFHGRRTATDTATVGLFENLLPLPVSLSPGEPFDAFVRRQGAVMAEVMEDSGMPFSRVQHMLAHPEMVIRHGFDAMLTLQSASGLQAQTLARASLRRTGGRLSFGDLSGEIVDCGDVATETALDLCLAQGDRIEGYLAYNRVRIGDALARRILTGFETLLVAAMESPGRIVDSLPILTADDAERYLDWSRGPGPDGHQPTAPDRFAAIAVKLPNAPAVADSRRALDYVGVSHAVDVLAARLMARDT